MDSILKIIDEMRRRNRERIEESINSDSPILILFNSIMNKLSLKYKDMVRQGMNCRMKKF